MYANTIDIESLCPFTGLRSFTEEESIYFKGRDGQIDSVAAQLAERKFLMLTGASGDGKSSLIYAGLIPQAKSGFFKSKYTNWSVVDFRPERSPLRNLIHAVARGFQLDASTVEAELSRGFSSLSDMYLNSTMYLEAGELASAQSDADRRQLQLKASNLLIIIDQFEEFFTNPENYSDDSPSHDAQLVVNLMLETSRIALERGLPIYVVFTMRSDYIGQCSSFRGLPEFIGYSQFFVPRLTRSELKQVIEEPAALNGNSISRRLTERLIYDLNEGIDQLPILQHALRQIWLRAAETGEQMDLIHYSMVGGLPANELPEPDKIRFSEWLDQLPESQRILFQEARLDRVIEIHARRLYDQAGERYAANYKLVTLDNKQIKNCIAITFACLTKIDNGRAVRNRMSLQEIASIINLPNVTHEVVAAILEIFRLPDNSFIRPFSFEQPGTLSGDTVLDITHESLIRNWRMLRRWADQEFSFYTTFEDLAKQLQRWKSSSMSSGHLIPIGPLTFFEQWYRDCKPNASWIQRYSNKSGDALRDRANAESLLSDLQKYLRLSARRVAGSRLLVKYGARKILYLVVVALAAVGATYLLYDVYRKHPSTVIKQVIAEGRSLLKSPDVPIASKADYVVAEELYSPNAGLRLLTAEIPVADRFSIYWDACRFLYLSKTFHGSSLRDSIFSRLDQELAGTTASLGAAEVLRMRSRYIHLLATGHYVDRAGVSLEKIQQNGDALFESITSLYAEPEVSGDELTILNESVQLWLTFGKASPEQIQHLISIVSPRQPNNRFDKIYQQGILESNGYRALNYAGGYHLLASLYAATGDVANLLWCFEQQQNITEYFTDRLLNTRSNVIGYLYQYGYRDHVPAVIAWITSHFPNVAAHQVYDDLLNRSGYMSEFERLNFGFRNTNEGGYFSLNLSFCPRAQYAAIVADYEHSISELSDHNEREFLLALHYKRLGLFSERYHQDRRMTNNEDLKGYYQRSFSHFAKLDAVSKNEAITYPYYYYYEIRTRTLNRQQLFYYPDVLGNWQHAIRHGESFFSFLISEELLESAYPTAIDLRFIPSWLVNLGDRWLRVENSKATMRSAIDFVKKHPQGSQVDMNIAKILLAHQYLVEKDTARGLAVYREIDIPLLVSTKQRAAAIENTIFLNELTALSGLLAANGNAAGVAQLNKGFMTPLAKADVYLYSAEAATRAGRSDVARIMLDSATRLVDGVNASTIAVGLNLQANYNNVAYAVGSKNQMKLADELYRNSLEAARLNILWRRVRGLVQRGNPYDALHSIPATLTEGQDLICRGQLLAAFARESDQAAPEAAMMYDEVFEVQDLFILFFN